MDKFNSIKRVSIFGVIGNIFLLIIKLLIGLVTNSQAMIGDALNSAGDIFASVMTFIGNKIAIEWEDFGHELDIVGRLIRIDNQDDATIFGFEICNICKDLSSYISTKQHQQRNK